MTGKKNKPKKMLLKNIMVPVLSLVIVGVVAFAAVTFLKGGVSGGSSRLEFQKGMGYVTWSNGGYLTPQSNESMKAMRETGADWTAILVTWYQTNCWSNDIHRMPTTPSDESVIHAIRTAKELGMKVMLKPHLDILDKSDGSWRGEIGCLKEVGWEEWFKQYTEFIMHYAKIAEDEGVEMICLGTELSTPATTKGYLWEKLIAKVRTKYSGLLTYAAHWDRYMDIRFWHALDYVGINAYFPLTQEMDPDYSELKKGWERWVKEMELFQKNVKKPIIFPEIGCNSCDGAAIRPWEHAPRSEVNLRLQKDYYKVLLDIFLEKDWFYGAYWWYWGTNPNMGGEFNRGFTPQNKPSQKIVEEYYAKSIKRPSKWENK